MIAKRLLFVVGAVAVLFIAPRLSHAQLEPYCCVCNGCSSGAAVQCISVGALGATHADCADRCAALPQSCQLLEVLDGFCELHAGDCMPSPAPAASRSVMFALGVLLVGGGVYLVQRRVTH